MRTNFRLPFDICHWVTQVKNADIQIYTSEKDDLIDIHNGLFDSDFDLYIFNSGTAPCFDVRLTMPPFIDRSEIVFPEKKLVQFMSYNDYATVYLGVINPDETLKINFEIDDLDEYEIKYILQEMNPYTIKLECVNDYKEKKVWFEE
jgi:hypothetical protein